MWFISKNNERGNRLILLGGEDGFSLPELLVTTVIFSVLMAGVFNAYFSQQKHTSREYKRAESDIELGIGKQLIEQDMTLSGFGLADDYSPLTFDPRPARVVNSATDSDELYLMGTALGIANRGSQGWSYFTSSTPTFRIWADDPRERIRHQDRVILIEPNSKLLLTESTGAPNEWLFIYNETVPNVISLGSSTTYTSPEIGTLVYGLYGVDASANDTNARPYYTVRYYLDDEDKDGNDDMPELCAPGTENLVRLESVTTELPTKANSTMTPMLSCVRDFQVAFGLDTTEDGAIDVWDNGGVTAATYSLEDMNDRLKRIKVYFLVQSGSRDNDFQYPAATVRVGEGSLGRDVTLTAEQRKYRWQLVALSIQPRNVR